MHRKTVKSNLISGWGRILKFGRISAGAGYDIRCNPRIHTLSQADAEISSVILRPWPCCLWYGPGTGLGKRFAENDALRTMHVYDAVISWITFIFYTVHLLVNL